MKKKQINQILVSLLFILFSSLILYFRSQSISKLEFNLNRLNSYEELTSINYNLINLKNEEILSPLIFGPYINLPPGNYFVYYNFFNFDSNKFRNVVFDITSDKSNTILAIEKLRTDQIPFGTVQKKLFVKLPNGANLVETRIFTDSNDIYFQSVQIEKENIKFPLPWQLLDVKLLLISFILTIIFLKFLALFTQNFSIKKQFLVLFILIVGGSILLPKHNITGDEPHYLFNTKNLLINKTLQIDQAYAPNITEEFWEGDIDKQTHMHKSIKTGNFYSHHGYLTSIFLVPGYVIAGLFGVRTSFAIISFGVAAISFLIIYELDKNNKKTAGLIAFSMFTFTPMIYYSYAIYPEIIAAFIWLFGLYSSWKKGYLLKIISLFLLGLTIHLKTKYIFPSIIIIFYILLNYLIQNKIKLSNSIKNYKFLFLMLVSIVSLSSFFIVNYLLFGNFSLFSFYTGGQQAQAFNRSLFTTISTFLNVFIANFFGSRAGIFIWMPITIFFPIGIIKLFKKNLQYKIFSITSILAIISYIVFYSASGSLGGASPPIRPWIAILPIILIITGLGIKSISNKLILITMMSFSLYQIIGSYIYQTDVINIYAHKFNPFFERTGTIFSHIGLLFPQMTAIKPIESWDIFAIFYLIMLILFLYKKVFKIKINLKK